MKTWGEFKQTLVSQGITSHLPFEEWYRKFSINPLRDNTNLKGVYYDIIVLYAKDAKYTVGVHPDFMSEPPMLLAEFQSPEEHRTIEYVVDASVDLKASVLTDFFKFSQDYPPNYEYPQTEIGD